jgi:hypothetical protein
MTAEECLVQIINAADVDDHEDIAIRKALVIALKESDIDFTEEWSRPILLPLSWRIK